MDQELLVPGRPRKPPLFVRYRPEARSRRHAWFVTRWSYYADKKPMPISIRPPGYLFGLPQLRKYPSSLGRKAVRSRAVGNLDVRTSRLLLDLDVTWPEKLLSGKTARQYHPEVILASGSRFLSHKCCEIHSICSHTVAVNNTQDKKTLM
jgi:hypothetical protein